MSTTKETFATLIKKFEYRYDVRSAFDDFLTMTICACSRNPITGLSHDEDLYLATVAKYKDDEIRFSLPKMLTCLVNEMQDRLDSEEGFDVLGEFYEENLYKKGTSQYFTPWRICKAMVDMTFTEINKQEIDRPLRIIDPACGSGRMILAASRKGGPSHEYYGIDIDHTCVKMTAINFFLGGLFKSEVMCGNALIPEDFRASYRVSLLPFGIFRIQEKEKSHLWRIYQDAGKQEQKQGPQKPFNEWKDKGTTTDEGSQLKLF